MILNAAAFLRESPDGLGLELVQAAAAVGTPSPAVLEVPHFRVRPALQGNLGVSPSNKELDVLQ
jgi:hypothetical protein